MKVIIVGGGQVGAYLASLLIEKGHQITIIESRESRIAALKRDLPENTIVCANGADPKALEAVGISKADVVAAVTGADETNLVIATIARFEYGVRRVIGRVNNPRNAWLFTPQMGVDAKVNQADQLARLVVEEMLVGDMMTLSKLHQGRYSLVEKIIDPSSALNGQTVAAIDFPPQCALVALIRGAQLILPHGDTVLLAGDEIIAVTHEDCREALGRLLGPRG